MSWDLVPGRSGASTVRRGAFAWTSQTEQGRTISLCQHRLRCVIGPPAVPPNTRTLAGALNFDLPSHIGYVSSAAQKLVNGIGPVAAQGKQSVNMEELDRKKLVAICSDLGATTGRHGKTSCST